ncbi:MAG: tRNA (N(6)-L-threonylcarbamoyladenosine(37)-C(2))-methylthiotransferase MtaB [Spirochaetaceae bacterium]|jgi:threonylcarbamoyladenosine tRNA methylthiotransferase MtaB|nr:tRNA (N(6)-L-threonylcarbamoyladenosine(37)-C(2))-methylthiotransferase MtaB [Spirochaetaceae bacterium]
MLKLAFITLGCKLNQLESESLASSFVAPGFALALSGEAPDLIIINTCTVTSKADQKARRILRKAARDYPLAAIVVSGCYAELEREKLASLADGVCVLPGSRKYALLELPACIEKAGQPQGPALKALIRDWAENALTDSGFPVEDEVFRFNPGAFPFHSRAFLKIQDGCNRRCAYCRVPLARGKSRSLAAGEVLARLGALEEKGYAEAVLTGVNINQYRDGDRGLPELLSCLVAGTGRIALRLSSTAVDGVSGAFIEAVGAERIRPHFHLSVQSGSDPILAAMGRPYRAADIVRAVESLRAVKDDPFIAADIISGFPGEREEHFAETYELCAALDFAWIHAFPFSPRPGTAAYTMKGRVPERDAADRVKALTLLAGKGRESYIRRWTGKTVTAVAEKNSPAGLNTVAGITDNYLRVVAVSAGVEPSSAFRCRVTGPWNGDAGEDGERIDISGEIIV